MSGGFHAVGQATAPVEQGREAIGGAQRDPADELRRDAVRRQVEALDAQPGDGAKVGGQLQGIDGGFLRADPQAEAPDAQLRDIERKRQHNPFGWCKGSRVGIRGGRAVAGILDGQTAQADMAAQQTGGIDRQFQAPGLQTHVVLPVVDAVDYQAGQQTAGDLLDGQRAGREDSAPLDQPAAGRGACQQGGHQQQDRRRQPQQNADYP